MPPPWAPPTNLRGENGSSDFLPPNLSHFADPVNNFSSSPLSAAASNDLSLSPHDPELSDHFSGGSWDATQNPDLAPNDPRRARIDSLQSLAEEDFYKEVQAAYGRGNSCCNRRRMVLVGMSLMFVGAAILAVVATAGRGWHWINPFAVSPLPGAVNVGTGSKNNNTSATGSDDASSSPEMSNPTLDHPLSQACRPTREHAERRQSCTDECAKYDCCSAPADSCAATQKEDCVIYRDMCDSELMKQQQPNTGNNDNAGDGDASGSENDEDPKEADTTDDNAAPAVAIRPANLDALCTKTSLETSEGRTLCETACRDHLCCFSLSALEGDGNTCSDDPDRQCDAYQPCANLIVEEAEDILESVEEQEADETGGDADTPQEEDNDGIISEAQVEEEAPIDDIEMEEIENEMEEAELDIQEAEKVMEEVEEDEQNEGLDEGYQEIGRNEDLPSHEKGGRDEGRLHVRSLRVRNLRASAYL